MKTMSSSDDACGVLDGSDADRVVVRRLAATDAGLLGSVAEGVFDEPVDRKRLATYLAESGHMLLVAIDADGTVVAQVAAVIHRHPDKPTELYIDEVGVAPSHQRRGIARRILGEMLAWGRERGCAEAWVGTEIDNVPARRLYESHGGEAEPFVLYEYDLTEGPDGA